MADEAVSLEQELQDAERILNETAPVVTSTAAEVTTVVTPPVVETVIEEVIPETTPPVKAEEEDPLHSEKSRLGRKVKRLEEKLEDTLADLKASLDFIKERTAAPQTASAPRSPRHQEEDDPSPAS